MLNRKEQFFSERNTEKSDRFVSTLLIFSIYLMALLAPSSVYATEPIDIDPDPDSPPPSMTIIVDESESLNLGNLPPGHYVIVVVGKDGSSYTYEMWL